MHAPTAMTKITAQDDAGATEGESGQGLVEYAMVLMVVALVVVGVLTTLGTQVTDMVQSVADAFP
jgi:pilus assembly protein Flp/PilA